MKKLLLALAFLASFTGFAEAQCNGVFPNNTVCGNVTGSSNTPRPTNPSAFLGAAGGTNGQIQYNNGGALGGFTASGDATINTSTGVVSLISSAVLSAINAGCVASPTTCAGIFGYYNIAWYGAVSGADTSSRNSNAIAAALNACAATPGMIWVPAGNFQYATQQVQGASNCTIAGTGQGTSILSYTGTGIGFQIGLTTGSNLAKLTYRSIQFTCTSTCTNSVYMQNVAEAIVFDNVAISAGGTGNHAIQLTSGGVAVRGSFDVHFTNGTVISGCVQSCAYLNPQSFGLVNAIYFDNVFFYGHQAQAIYATSGVGLYANHIHVERHLGTSVTTAAIHLDNMVNWVFRDSYFEDEANAPQFDLGGGLTRGTINNLIINANVTGASAANATFIKQNGSTPNMTGVVISSNSVSVAGTVGNVIDLGASDSITLANNTLSVGTATWGIASSVTQTIVDVSGLTTSGTFTSGASQIVQATTCTGTPGASFSSNWAGRVTHC